MSKLPTVKKNRRKSEKCVIKNGGLANRTVMLGWNNPGCTIKELRADGVLVPYKLTRNGEKNERGQSYLIASEPDFIAEHHETLQQPLVFQLDDTNGNDGLFVYNLSGNYDYFNWWIGPDLCQNSLENDHTSPNGNPDVFRHGF